MIQPYKYLESQKKWKEENPDKLKQYSKNYYYRNSQPVKRLNKESSKENKIQVLKLSSQRMNKKEIAEKLGISYSYVRRILNEPELCKDL